MLKLGGILNIIIAIAHILGLFWAKQMFYATGVGKDMEELANINNSLPYLLTIFVAIIFFIFGLYALSANGNFRKLPYLKLGIYSIAGIYIFRGIGEMLFHTITEISKTSETIQSLIALLIGALYLFGGLKKWRTKN